ERILRNLKFANQIMLYAQLFVLERSI
ncbi:MAG: hypothetical protein RIR89_166, partial [Actinomycetota bacterium]